jgi:ATP-dependent protease ClpP protease subunit
MYHECLDELVYDKLSILTENLEETKRVMEVYDKFLIEKTGLKKKQLDEVKKLKKDWYMSPDEALKYKIIDKII